MKNRLVMLGFTLILVVAMLCACTAPAATTQEADAPTETDAAAAEEPADTPAAEEPAAEEPADDATAEEPADAATADAPTQYDVSYIYVWNGSTVNVPNDQVNNPAAQYVRENYGLNVTMEGINSNETEYLNMMFAAGTMPDFALAPFWGSMGGEGYVITKAASEGQIKDLTDILPEFPAINDNYETYLTRSAKEYSLGDERFGGRRYVIPRHVTPIDESKLNVTVDAMFARKDIMETVGVNPDDVKTLDDLYNLLVSIKNAGLKGWDGSDMIPLGTNHGGWRQENIFNWLDGDQISGFRLVDGKTVHYLFDTNYVEGRVLFGRKLVQENLIDLECFTQSNALASEKFAQGRVAVAPIDADLAGALYRDYSDPNHPEAEWVLLGMRNQDDNPTVDTYAKGIWNGGGVFFFNPNIDEGKLRAILTFMTDVQEKQDVYLRTKWGIEGEDYTIDKGYPVRTQAYTDGVAADIKYAANLGIGDSTFGWTMIDYKDMWWEVPVEDKPLNEQMAEKLKAPVRPTRAAHTHDLIPVTYLASEYEGYEQYNELANGLTVSTDTNGEFARAFFAETEEEAMAIVQEWRDGLTAAGVEGLCEFIDANFDPERFGY